MKTLLKEVHGIWIRMDVENMRVTNQDGWGKYESLQKSEMFQFVSISYTHTPGELKASPSTTFQFVTGLTRKEIVTAPGLKSVVNLQ